MVEYVDNFSQSDKDIVLSDFISAKELASDRGIQAVMDLSKDSVFKSNLSDQRVDERLQEIDEDLGFAVTAKQKFEDGDDFKRRDIVFRLGSNLILTDHSLGTELRKPLEKADNSEQFKLFLSENPKMGG